MKALPLVIVLLASNFVYGESKEELLNQLRQELGNETKVLKEKDGPTASFHRGNELLMLLRRASENGERESGYDLAAVADQIEGWSSNEKTQRIANALAREVRTNQEKEDAAKTDEIRKTITDALKTALAATSAKDLDTPLAAVNRLIQEGQNPGRNPRGRPLPGQAQQVGEFLRQWQDYWVNVDAGDFKAAAQSLNNLTNSTRDFSAFIPRSELQNRLKKLERREIEDPRDGDPIKMEHDMGDALREVKTLDDLEPALKKFDSIMARSQGAWPTRYVGTFEALRALYRNYKDLKDGLATNISVSSATTLSAYENAESLAAIRHQLIIYAIPRLLNLKPEETNPNENALTIIQRILAKYKADQDWENLRKIIDLASALGLTTIADSADSQTLRAFMAGQNQDRAKQYAFAVASYLAALKTGSQLISAELIGARLERIKMEHPEEYQRGVEITLTPPQPAYDPRFPQGMSRGGPSSRTTDSPQPPSVLSVPAAPPKSTEKK